MKLIQKQGYRHREFTLEGKKLYVKTSSLGEKNEFTVDIEHVGEERHYQTFSNVAARIVGIVLYILLLTAIIGFLQEDDWSASENLGALFLAIFFFGGIGSWAFFTPKRNEMYLVGGSTHVMFFLNSPSKDEMENFVNELIARSRKILTEKYSKIDPDLPEEMQINNLYWLKQRGLISEEDYEDLKVEYRNQRLMR